MKKSLIALAVASAFVAPVAMADTTIYGQANASFGSVNDGTDSVMKVSSDSSRLGFKGSEDLGGGTSVVYQMESAIELDNAGAGTALATRNSYVGLSNASMGTVLAGRNDTPYKSATRGLDVFGDTIADNRNLMGRSGSGMNFDGRNGNTVAYVSPAMSNVTVAVAYVTANEAKPTNSAVSMAGMYAAGPISASLAYESHTFDAPVATFTKESAIKIGGSYSMDQFAINAVYEKTSDTGTAKADHSAFYLAGKFNVSATDAVKAAYTNLGKVGGNDNNKATQISLGYDHSLSKRTMVYALYTTVANKSAASYGLSGGNSTGGIATSTGVDKDPNAFAVGLKHSF